MRLDSIWMDHWEGCLVVHSVEEAISLAQSRGESEVFVCGGSEIYERTAHG